MRTRGLLVSVALLALLGGAAWWSSRNNSGDEASAASSELTILNAKAADLRRVEIRRSPGETTTIERPNGKDWQLTSPAPYRLDISALSAFLESVAKVDADRLVDEKVADFGPYGLKEPRYYVLVTAKDGKLRTLLIGDETPTGSGYFARLAGDQRLFTIATLTRSGIDKRALDLRDKRLLILDESKLTRLVLALKGASTELTRTAGGDWRIASPQSLRADGGQVEEVLRRLRELNLNPYLLPEDDAKNDAAFASAAPFAAITVAAPDTQTLDVRKARDGRFLARSSVVEGTHVVAPEAAPAFAKGVAELRNARLFDFGFNNPSRIAYKDAQVALSVSKSGEKWTSAGKEMDGVGVQSLIDRLRSLAASRFTSSAPPAQEIEIAVVSSEGKHTEKVLFGKSGAVWVARRDGEPSLYEIDSATMESLMQSARDVKPAQTPKADHPKK